MKQKDFFLSLKSKKDISRIFSSGEKIYSKNILVRYLLSQESTGLPWKAAFALPKKELGAVGRNRLRRICKSALYQAMKNLFLSSHFDPTRSYDIVVHARERFNEISEHERILEFEGLISRLSKMEMK